MGQTSSCLHPKTFPCKQGPQGTPPWTPRWSVGANKKEPLRTLSLPQSESRQQFSSFAANALRRSSSGWRCFLGSIFFFVRHWSVCWSTWPGFRQRPSVVLFKQETFMELWLFLSFRWMFLGFFVSSEPDWERFVRVFSWLLLLFNLLLLLLLELHPFIWACHGYRPSALWFFSSSCWLDVDWGSVDTPLAGSFHVGFVFTRECLKTGRDGDSLHRSARFKCKTAFFSLFFDSCRLLVTQSLLGWKAFYVPWPISGIKFHIHNFSVFRQYTISVYLDQHDPQSVHFVFSFCTPLVALRSSPTSSSVLKNLLLCHSNTVLLLLLSYISRKLRGTKTRLPAWVVPYRRLLVRYVYYTVWASPFAWRSFPIGCHLRGDVL